MVDQGKNSSMARMRSKRKEELVGKWGLLVMLLLKKRSEVMLLESCLGLY